MQHTELRGLPMRSAGRHPEPLVVEGQLHCLSQVELGWIAQAGESICIAVRRTNSELAGKELLHSLTGPISDFHPRLVVLFSHLKNESGARLRPRLQRSVAGEETPDYFARFRGIEPSRRRQNSLSLAFIRPWGTSFLIASSCFWLRGAVSASYFGNVCSASRASAT